ncbi:MAG: hypothetical protein HY905_02855 [Deltaproteobacteria bacterium]|nr:hypothetical protein [Deltaproteobacteria bacterium]
MTRPDIELRLLESVGDAWECRGGINVANVWVEEGFILLRLPAAGGC